MEITINIKAPELVKAIEVLAAALSNQKEQVVFGKIGNQPEPGATNLDPSLQAAVMSQQSQQTAVMAQQAQQTAPIVPVAPIQQPLQQAPVQAIVPTAPIQQPELVHQPVTAPVQPQPQAVPTSAPTYNMDQLAVAATQLMDAGKRNELLQLLASFGVQALTQLPTEQYGAFATKLRELGAKI